jgi:hypothetical protein
MMNKRIQKLFNEAGFHQPEMERLGIEDKFEKFAELIVRECGILADQYRFEKKNPNPLATERLPLLPSDFIYEHFGV